MAQRRRRRRRSIKIKKLGLKNLLKKLYA